MKKIQAIITPYPISSAVFGDNVKGPVLQYMFPCSGTITKGLVDIGKRLKEGVLVGIELKTQLGGESKSYAMRGKKFLVEPQVEISAGDKLTVSIEPNGVEKINEAWVSFLWLPNIKETDIHNILLDSLDRIEEDSK